MGNTRRRLAHFPQSSTKTRLAYFFMAYFFESFCLNRNASPSPPIAIRMGTWKAHEC
jgi:hypothetical protein